MLQLTFEGQLLTQGNYSHRATTNTGQLLTQATTHTAAVNVQGATTHTPLYQIAYTQSSFKLKLPL